MKLMINATLLTIASCALLTACGGVEAPIADKQPTLDPAYAAYFPVATNKQIPAPLTMPDCPNWSKDPTSNHQNTLHSNYGCATWQNLANQIDDPRDFIQGRGVDGQEPYLNNVLIDAYRAGP